MLIQLGAGSLSALCCWFSWRTLHRCRALASSSATAAAVIDANAEPDGFEQRLAERETNAALNLAKRSVKGWAQAAFTGGLCSFFLALTGGKAHHAEAIQALALGGVGAVACLSLRREIGSLAESWRGATNRRNRQRGRQGVDQP